MLRMKRRRWTAEDVARLRAFFPNSSTRATARKLARTVTAVNGAAHNLGLKKSQTYLAGAFLKLVRRGLQAGARHRFPPGHVPANKGLRRPGYAPGRMAETQFKKGQRPHTWLPVGTVQANSDGYLRRKITDGRGGIGANSKDWEFVHRRVWEKAHGPIPKGHRLWWKDRDHDNCALENLELLSDVEHMARTTIHNLHPDLKRAILMKGALTRKIREMQEEKTDGEKQTDGSTRSFVRDAGRTQGQGNARRHQPREGRRQHRAGHHRLGQARTAVPGHDRAGAAKRIPRAAKG